MTTVLDVVLPGRDDYWSQLVRLLPETDVFLPNHDEGRIITGLDNPRHQALKFLDAGVRTVAITCGGEGTVLVGEGLRVQAGAHRVQYVGGTGAGDAFDAGYIAGLVAGADALESLAWGSAPGPVASAPSAPPTASLPAKKPWPSCGRTRCESPTGSVILLPQVRFPLRPVDLRGEPLAGRLSQGYTAATNSKRRY